MSIGAPYVIGQASAAAGNTSLVLLSSIPQANGTVLVHLQATPKDRFGSFLGPDYLPHLEITSTEGTVELPISDTLNGSYEITYRLPSTTSNPTIGLVVMGDKVKEAKLSDLKKGGGGTNFGKWVGSFHLGGTIPHSNLNAFSSSVSLGADLEYRLNKLFSLETYLGYDRFSANVGNDFSFVNLSERVKATFGTGNVRPFVFAGVGAYFPSSGSTHPGFNTGTGLQYWFAPRVAVEGSYNFHNVFISSGDARYSTVLAGVRFVIK